MSAFYLATGYDSIGLPVWRRIYEGRKPDVIAIVEMTLCATAEIKSIELDCIDFGPFGTLRIDRAYETRVPF